MDFNLVYNNYFQKVYRLCMGFVNDHELAKDWSQDVFMIVLKELPKFRNESSVGTWVYRIATNNCLRQIEKSSKIKKFPIDVEFEDVILPDIEKKLAFLFQCIAHLQEIDRIIISLELEEVKQADIAIIVGISESNVRVRIHRIKEKIARKFEYYEE